MVGRVTLYISEPVCVKNCFVLSNTLRCKETSDEMTSSSRCSGSGPMPSWKYTTGRPAKPMKTDYVPALANFRDLGGLPTDDARLTRRGVLYRSDAPKAGDRPPPELPWPPNAVIDLRSADEAIDPHPLRALHTAVVQVDLLGNARQKTVRELRTGGGVNFQVVYRDLISRAGEEAHAVLELLLDTDGPVLVHCAAGKDRT